MNTIGNTLTTQFLVRDNNDALVDADTLPVVTVTLPDATTATPTVTHGATGTYSFKYLPAVGGEFGGKAVGTVGGDSFLFPCNFSVWDPNRFVLSLDDVKRQLNITSNTGDDELRDFIIRGQSAIEKRVGPLKPTTVTRQLSGCRSALILPVTPVISLTSVTPIQGTALPAASLNVTPAGVVSYIYGGSFPLPFYTAVWSAGWQSVDGDLYLALLETVRHLWSTQRPNSRLPWQDQQQDDPTQDGASAPYLWPWRVEQLLIPYEQTGFA